MGVIIGSGPGGQDEKIFRGSSSESARVLELQRVVDGEGEREALWP